MVFILRQGPEAQFLLCCGAHYPHVSFKKWPGRLFCVAISKIDKLQKAIVEESVGKVGVRSEAFISQVSLGSQGFLSHRCQDMVIMMKSFVRGIHQSPVNRPVSQMRAPPGGLSRTSGKLWQSTWTAICFEHKTQYLLIRAPYTRIVVFWHISKIPTMIGQSQISCNTPTFCIATIFVKYCYTTGSWLL